MHVPDGFLPEQVWLGGYAISGAAMWLSLRQIDRLDNPQAFVPKASLFTAAFFVASWIHIPVPPVSVHLTLNGLLGVLLGPFAFPAIGIGLFFQAVLFQHGGLSVLGLNAAILGLPAILAAQVYRCRLLLPPQRWVTALLAAIAGASGVAISALLFGLVMGNAVAPHLDLQVERAAVLGVTLAHMPLALIEGAMTAAVVLFLRQVHPQLLEVS